MATPLAQLFPGLAAIDVAGIAELPTPLEELPANAAELERLGRLLVKRDDLTSAAYGGNKVRKLDFLLGEAKRRGARSVVTFGAYGSNHALATAVHGTALGLEVHAVLSPQEPGPYAPRTLRAHAGLGTHLHLVDGWDGRREAVAVRRRLAERDAVEPCIIPMGGTSPLGAVGYVNAAVEMAMQLRESGQAVGTVYTAAGTLGTAVGLAVGFHAASVALGTAPTAVEAVRVTPLQICNEQIAATLTAEVCSLLAGVDDAFPVVSFEELALTLRHEFFEPGYGVVTPETTRAVEVASAAGLKLETTYTGKAFHAMLADGSSGRFDGASGRGDGGSAAFWNTYSSAPYPAPGPDEALPDTLRAYIAECERIFGRVES